jgi:hypothetical protein
MEKFISPAKPLSQSRRHPLDTKGGVQIASPTDKICNLVVIYIYNPIQSIPDGFDNVIAVGNPLFPMLCIVIVGDGNFDRLP